MIPLMLSRRWQRHEESNRNACAIANRVKSVRVASGRYLRSEKFWVMA
jgi:hypothetical protein